MKKRLFITSALMTAVMAASLATGTYAWYVTGAGTGVSLVEATSKVNTAANSYSAGAVTFNANISSTGAPKLTDNKGKTYYYLGSVGTNNKAEDTGAQLTDKYATGTVSITGVLTNGAGASATYKEVMTSLIGKKYKITVTSSDANVKFFDSVPTAEGFNWAGAKTWSSQVITIATEHANQTDNTAGNVLGNTNFYWGYSGEDKLQEQAKDITLTATITEVTESQG